MAYRNHWIGSGDGKARLAYRSLTIRRPNQKSRLVLNRDVEVGDVVLEMSEQIDCSQGLGSAFARDLGMAGRCWLNSSWAMEALGLGRVKVIQDNSISALAWRAQTVNPLDLEKASPIYPQAQPAAPWLSLRREQRTRCRQLRKGEGSSGLQQL